MKCGTITMAVGTKQPRRTIPLKLFPVLHQKRRTRMNLNEVSKFTCKVCGGRELTVTHVWTLQAGDESERWQEWGLLKNDHHWKYEFKEKVDQQEEEEAERGDFGEFALDDSDSEPQEYEVHEVETDREDDEFLLNCGNCEREVEFGWSQPDRRGLILPVEFSDFVPAESWPDPKYLEAWQQRGWLRTTERHPILNSTD